MWVFFRFGLLVFSLTRGCLSERSWCDVMVEDESWFRCENRAPPNCVSLYYRCDNVMHCTDNSDEENCDDNAPEAPHRGMETYCSGCSELEHAILEHHNTLRVQEPAANMNQLQWSVAAVSEARLQAEACQLPIWGESPHGHMEPGYSQNVARMYTNQKLPDRTVLGFIDAWYGEKQYYNYDKDSCTDQCGHYTVLVTAYSREVGCALVHCDRKHAESGEHKVFWNFVCNYSPGYNWMVWTTHPDQPYIRGDQSCAQCQPGLLCRDNLCA